MAESDISRRLLQSEQPTSTTAGPSEPRSALVDTARPARAGPMGLGPHPPHRPSDSGDAAAATSRATLAGRGEAFARHQPRFHESGAGRISRASLRARLESTCRRLSFFMPRSPLRALRPSACCGTRCGGTPGDGGRASIVTKVTRAHESFAPTRSARTPLVTTPPRHRLETDVAGRRHGRSRTTDTNDAVHEPSPSRARENAWARSPVRLAHASRPPSPLMSCPRLRQGRTRAPANRCRTTIRLRGPPTRLGTVQGSQSEHT